MVISSTGLWSRVKAAIAATTPPAIINKLNYAKRTLLRQPHEWEYVPEGWQREQVDSNVKGWNVQTISEVYQSRWEAFERSIAGNLPLGVSFESVATNREDSASHNTIMRYLIEKSGARPPRAPRWREPQPRVG